MCMCQKIQVADGNSKMGKIPNTSFSPISGCRPGVPCAKRGECYALGPYTQYLETRAAWDRNIEIAKNDLPDYLQQLNERIARIRKDYFRFQVSGDLGFGTNDLEVEQDHLSGLYSISRENKGKNFLLFTKCYNLDFRYRPKNLKVFFSMWPEYYADGWNKKMPKAWLYDPENVDPRIPEDAIPCAGKCDQCFVCWHCDKDIVFTKHR